MATQAPEPDGAPAALWSSFFTARGPGGSDRLGRAWVVGLYLLGLVWWCIFFNWGSIPVDFHDWAEISAPRIAFVRDAVIKGQLPLHMPDASALRGLTDRFLVIPDVITAPQMVLMGLIETRPFILVDVLLLYTLGVLGLLWFRRRYGLSPLVYGILFLAFNFNGQIVSHFGVGHVNYTGYFLFPWLAALILKLIEAPQGWRWIAQMAFLLFFMLLQGAFHQFIWSLMFLGLLGLAAWKRLGTILLALLSAGLLSAVRLLPPVLGLGLFDNEFLSGYPRPWDYLSALVRLVPPLQAYTERFAHHSLGWWEYDLYLGWAGTALVGLGLVFWLWPRENRRQYRALLLPVLGMSVLSFWQLYRPIAQLPIPLLSSERVSARLAILPFTIALLMAAIFLQRWLDQKPRGLLVQLPASSCSPSWAATCGSTCPPGR